jgi:hypothetical protein
MGVNLIQNYQVYLQCKRRTIFKIKSQLKLTVVARHNTDELMKQKDIAIKKPCYREVRFITRLHFYLRYWDGLL